MKHFEVSGAKFPRTNSKGDIKSVDDNDSSCCSSEKSVSGLIYEPNSDYRRHSLDKETNRNAVEIMKAGIPNSMLESSTVSSSSGLGEIQQSVRRLRAQRTHVERLTQRNEELEHQLAEQKAENETLQREVFTLRGTEAENVAYLQSVKMLEQRARGLEESYNAKKVELKTLTEKLGCVERERDQLQHEVQTARQDYEEYTRALRNKQKKLLQRIDHLEHSHGVRTDEQKRLECHWKHKMKTAARASLQIVDTLQQQLETSTSKIDKLNTEVHELENQVQTLLATTVRQTTVIEECDRVLSETKAQQHRTQQMYEEQLQLFSEVSAKTQRLEVQIASLKQSKGSEIIELENKVVQLESKLFRRKDQARLVKEALREKEKEIETMQRAYVTRDSNHLHLDKVVHFNSV
ncbi:unnamed protein product [Phytophthora lilii]|uniref:Unnamed protein product n=1 Tax=Phytophthora lilii TaxID=2077276 RepID=A0A9W6XCM1_9STRA|nr:unnamed protein product [Phytophthora lilii]